MTLPVSRRHFLGTSAGSAVALTSGPLLAQAGALPSQKVTVGIMGLNRGMQVIDALEKQPGVVIKYVCDVDSKRADKGKADLDKRRHPAPAGDHGLSKNPGRQGSGRALLRSAQSLARPRDDPGVRRRQARLRREAVQPQSLGRRANDRGRPQAQPGGANGRAAAEHARRDRGHDQAARRGHRQRVLCAKLVQQPAGHRSGNGKQTDPPGDARLRALAGAGPAHALSRQPHPLQLALVLALGERRARQ